MVGTLPPQPWMRLSGDRVVRVMYGGVVGTCGCAVAREHL